jgi:Spy/CpxP family protein refolding chaperone
MVKGLVMACLAVSLAYPAFAQMNKPMGPKGPGPGMGLCNMCNMDGMGGMMGNCLQHADEIGLTDDQITKITPIHREMQKKMIRYKSDLEVARIELKEIMDVKDFNLEKANAQIKKIEGIRTNKHLEMLKSMKEVRSILTDEQFKKMKKLMPNIMDNSKPSRKMMKNK